MKSIKELEISIGVSKVSIYKMLKRPEYKGHVFKDAKNITLIDAVGEELLKTHYNKEQTETISHIVDEELDSCKENNYSDNESKEDCKPDSKDNSKPTSKPEDQAYNGNIIRILEEQIQAKDEQINNLLNIILNQQKIQGVQLIQENQQEDICTSPESEPIKEFKTSFWQQILKRRK